MYRHFKSLKKDLVGRNDCINRNLVRVYRIVVLPQSPHTGYLKVDTMPLFTF